MLYHLITMYNRCMAAEIKARLAPHNAEYQYVWTAARGQLKLAEDQARAKYPGLDVARIVTPRDHSGLAEDHPLLQ